MRFGINAASSLAARFVSLTVLVWVNQHLLKRIDPEEYSLFPLVMSLMVFSDLFVAVFVGGVSRHLVEAHHLADPDGVPRVVSSMLVVLIPVSLILCLAGGVAAWHIDSLLEISPEYLLQARMMLALTVARLALSTATTPITQGLYVQERFVLSNLIGLACEALRILLLMSLLLGVGTRVMWLVVASTIATFVNTAIQIALTRRLLPTARFRLQSVSWSTTKGILAFGAWTSVHGIGQLLSTSAPVLLLNRFSSALDVAMFHVGRLPEGQIRGLLGAIEGPAQPALVGLFAREGRDAVNKLYYRGGRYSLWLVLLPAAPLLVFAQPLYRLYAGEEYTRAGLVMIAFLGSYPFQYASAMFYRVAHAIGKIGAFHRYFLVLQLVAVIACFYAVVIRGGGAVEAAFALGITFAVLHVLMIWPMGLRLVGGRWRDFAKQTLATGMFPFLASAATSLVMARLLTVDSWWMLGVAGACSLLAYMAVLYFWCLDDLDLSLMKRGLKRIGLRGTKKAKNEGT